MVHIENPADEKALNIALNKATGDWEPVALAELLQDLQLSGYDLGATGFDAAEVDDLFSKVHDKDVHDDDCDIDPDELTPYVQPGDIWTLSRHRMMCGDSTDPDTVDLLMDGVKANLVVTDPPYNVAYESADGKKIQNDSMADEQFFLFLLAAFKNMAAHMAEGGSAYIFHADTEGLNFRRAFKESGFHISGVCIWVKNSLVLGRSPYQWQHEPVLYGWLPNGKHKWFSDRKQSTIWNFDNPKKSADHPTMKPIPLLAYPIKNSSAPNAVVMDLFGGSGSTLMACEQTDRICRTMELDPKYATVIVERFHAEYPEQEITVSGLRIQRTGNRSHYFQDHIEEGILPKVWPEARTRKSRKAKPEEAPMPERITVGLHAALEQAEAEGQTVAKIAEAAAQGAEITAELNGQELTITAHEPENMEAAFNVTGERRKALIEAIKAFVDAPAMYQNAPSFAYVIGNYTVSKTGTVSGPANDALMAALNAKGFIIE